MPIRWPFSRSLLYPLTAVLLVLAVVPVGLLGWASVTSNREQIATREKQYLTRQAESLARQLELEILKHTGPIETLARNLSFSSGRSLTSDEATAALDRVMRTDSDIALLRFMDSSGRGVSAQNRELPAAALEAPAWDEGFRANVQHGSPRSTLIRLGRAQPLLVVSLPIGNDSGRAVGALQGLVVLTGIARRVGEESARGAVIDVVDESGFVVFSTDQARVGRSAAQHPLVAQFLSAPHAPVRPTQIYRDPLREERDQVLGSLWPVEDVRFSVIPRWAVVTARAVDVAFAPVQDMARRTALHVALTACVAMLAGIVLARRITSPLRHLTELTTAVAKGDFTGRVPVESRNEVGQLAGNFNAMAGEIGRYVSSLHDALQENQALLVESIRALAAAIDAKSPYTHGHSERVCQYAVAIAKHSGVQGEELKRIEIAALLHDVGKIGIEDAILQKPGILTDDEFVQMRAHTVKGATIVSSIKRLEDILPGIRSHHENWAGGGYPDGLAGEAIPFLARIIAAADAFDAMTTQRPYQAAMSLDAVCTRMRQLSGRRLDPVVVEAFFAALAAGDLSPLAEVEVA
jgi:HD-GYP domain-containing protein (c-di-GMP phosphodiesterase class II)